MLQRSKPPISKPIKTCVQSNNLSTLKNTFLVVCHNHKKGSFESHHLFKSSRNSCVERNKHQFLACTFSQTNQTPHEIKR